MIDFKVDDCRATFSLEKHYEAPTRLFYITGKVTHPTHGKVATLSGLALSCRVAWRNAGDFMSLMEAETDEMMRFSSYLFDMNMNLLSWLYDGGRRSGTGCWGAELNRGDIVFIQEMTVDLQVSLFTQRCS